jgi:mannose-6-phosphate isomerase-like protein (cupin superfamily)
MTHVEDYRAHVGVHPNKFYKATLFQSPRLLLGLNCLEPGQTQPVHDHADQDKFYVVMEGEGEFVVGDERRRVGPGLVVWAPAGVAHGVSNPGLQRLVVLMGIAPAP